MNYFKSIFSVVFISISILNVSAQFNDEFISKIWNDSTHSDTNKLREIDSFIWESYMFTYPDSAFYYAQFGYDLAKSINNEKWMATILNTQGLSFFFQGNYDKALMYFQRSLSIRESIEDYIGMGDSYNNIGLVYSYQNNNEKALMNCERSLKLKGIIGDTLGMKDTYHTIGLIYLDKSDTEEAYENFNKSLDICQKVDDKRGMSSCFSKIGDVYKMKGNLNESLINYEKSLSISEEIHDKIATAISLLNIGEIYSAESDYNIALTYFLKAKKIYEEINTIKNLDKLSKAIYELYKKLGDSKKALENHELYISVKDSLAKMDGVQKEKQRHFHELYMLEKQADSIKHADEIIIHQSEVTIQEQRNNGLIIISIIILSFLGLVFYQLKKVRFQKNIVEVKQKEITDSINYAKRLQQGILVPLDLVQSWLSDTFIFFKPKDIVSGDFYWIEKVGDRIFFAVADCTGHGIPGALVSIICSNALSKSLNEDKRIEPSKILDNTREIVEESFKRSADNIKDGMDISLCCLDVVSKTITWSGAMNPLWILRKNSDEVEVLKPDRQAIGSLENPKLFTQHKLKLDVGDSLYLFSDGFQDQFGGLKGKKYMKAKMKNFILSIKSQDMQQQLFSFKKEFNDWKGLHNQVDDVCVMGVRIT